MSCRVEGGFDIDEQTMCVFLLLESRFGCSAKILKGARSTVSVHIRRDVFSFGHKRPCLRVSILNSIYLSIKEVEWV